MTEERRDHLKEIAKYSKEEIIEALGRQVIPLVVLDNLLGDLEHLRIRKAIDEHKKAFEAEQAAFDAYMAWRKEKVAKYGDGKIVTLSNIPRAEITRGAALEKAWNAAREKERKTNAKVEKLLKLWRRRSKWTKRRL